MGEKPSDRKAALKTMLSNLEKKASWLEKKLDLPQVGPDRPVFAALTKLCVLVVVVALVALYILFAIKLMAAIYSTPTAP